MYRKQNRNPNKSQHISNNKSVNGKHAQPTSTPDSNTSRINYKPKFIKKMINIQHELIGETLKEVETPQQSAQQEIETYMHSPTSITEHNTLDIDSIAIRSKWKQLYSSTKQELQIRTQKFDKSINIFCYVLNDMKKIINDQRLAPQEKLSLSQQRIDHLLDAFEQFQAKL